jgi:hypothetical protein
MRSTAVTSHEESTPHNTAVQENSNRKLAAEGKSSTAVELMVQQATHEERTAVSKLLHATLFLAQHNLALSLLQPLRQLVTTLGGTDSGLYTGHDLRAELLACLAQPVRAGVLAELKESPFFALMVDETTDVAVKKQLMIYAKFVKHDGAACSRYIGVRELPNGKAETIFDEIMAFLTRNDLDVKKLIALGTDGASVMTGQKTGVAKRLEALNAFLIAVHCIAHRLALAAGQSAKTINYLKHKYLPVVYKIYSFFNNSAVRKAELKKLTDELGLDEFFPKEPKDTRWLSHGNATAAIWEHISVLIRFLRDNKEIRKTDPTAPGMAKVLCTFFFLATLNLFADVLPKLNDLSRFFQSKTGVDLVSIQPRVQGLTELLLQWQTTLSPKLFDLKDWLFVKTGLAADLGLQEADYNAKFDKWSQQVRVPLLRNLRDHILARFPRTDLTTALGAVFNPTDWPPWVWNKPESLEGFGDQSILELANHFGRRLEAKQGAADPAEDLLPEDMPDPEFKLKPVAATPLFRSEELPAQWVCARPLLLKIAQDIMQEEDSKLAAAKQKEAKTRAQLGPASKDLPRKETTPAAEPASLHQRVAKPSMAAVLQRFLKQHVATHTMVPGIVKLANVATVIPAHTVDCERGFHALKLAKTRLRSTLLTQTLDNLLTVHLEAPEMSHMDFSLAEEAFFTRKHRQVNPEEL